MVLCTVIISMFEVYVAVCGWWCALAAVHRCWLPLNQSYQWARSHGWAAVQRASWNMPLQSLDTPFCCWFILGLPCSTLKKRLPSKKRLLVMVALSPRQALSKLNVTCLCGLIKLRVSCRFRTIPLSRLELSKCKIRCSSTPVGTDEQCSAPHTMPYNGWCTLHRYVLTTLRWDWHQLRAHYTRTHARRMHIYNHFIYAHA